METKTYKIDGMGCSGCAASIQKALEASDKVTSAKVSYDDETAAIVSELNKQQLAIIVENAGYRLL